MDATTAGSGACGLVAEITCRLRGSVRVACCPERKLTLRGVGTYSCFRHDMLSRSVRASGMHSPRMLDVRSAYPCPTCLG
eukprot:scaffold604_cov384-Prasinococcus_capsulatus_cf.AAC.32